MSNLKRNINRFFFNNRDKGIPRLMLWVCAGNAIVFLVNLLYPQLYSLLCFYPDAILRGEVWRLFSYILTFAVGKSFFFSKFLGAIISILFYFWIGNVLEQTCGTFKFTLFYLTGILLSDLFSILLFLLFRIVLPISSHYVNLSMFLAVASLIPEQRVYIYMILPVKMKWLAWVDLGFTLYGVISSLILVILYWPISNLAQNIGQLIAVLFPFVALLNFFLFFGSNAKNLLPKLKKKRTAYRPYTVPPKAAAQPSSSTSRNARTTVGARPYRHKCTVCGRTDTQCPDLEFRYCSKCTGYFCYCIDHINNHTHVQ